MADHRAIARALACRFDDLTGWVEPRLGLGGDIVARLDSGEHRVNAEDAKARAQMIAAIRAGQHAELDVQATTFRQKDGMPNRRFLRHKPESLESLAASYVGMPFLVDHDTHAQASRVGTITASKLHEHGGTGWSSFKMSLHAVKPDAVISILDGTIDRFSIGWSRNGAVLCSVHGVDVTGRESCGCWPGDTVMLDGKPHVVEFEFQSAKGTEVSAVNVPAVEGTGIGDVRAALAAELSFVVPVPPAKETVMLTRLAAVLGLSALTAAEEDRAVANVEEMRRGRLAAEQERDTARTRVTQLETELKTAKTSGLKTAVDAVLNEGYRTGRLVFGRDSENKALPDNFEPMLRQLAEHSGVDKLQATLATMPVRVPLGQHPLELALEPALSFGEGGGFVMVQMHSARLNAPVALPDHLAAMARGCNLDPADVLDTLARNQEGA